MECWRRYLCGCVISIVRRRVAKDLMSLPHMPAISLKSTMKDELMTSNTHKPIQRQCISC